MTEDKGMELRAWTFEGVNYPIGETGECQYEFAKDGEFKFSIHGKNEDQEEELAELIVDALNRVPSDANKVLDELEKWVFQLQRYSGSTYDRKLIGALSDKLSELRTTAKEEKK